MEASIGVCAFLDVKCEAKRHAETKSSAGFSIIFWLLYRYIVV